MLSMVNFNIPFPAENYLDFFSNTSNKSIPMMSITFHKSDGTPEAPPVASRIAIPVKKMGPPVRNTIPKATDLPNQENSVAIPKAHKPEETAPSLAAPQAVTDSILPTNQPSVEMLKFKDIAVAKPVISEGIQVPTFTTPAKSAPAPFEVKSFASPKSTVKT